MSDTLALVQANSLGLSHVEFFLEHINNEQYKSSSHWLFGGSPGAHIRHILEFYSCLASGLKSDSINYDLRERNYDLEHQRLFARAQVEIIQAQLATIHQDMPIALVVADLSGNWISIPSSLHRELVYTLEHLTHHLAILKIFMLVAYPEIPLPDNFGVAHSTIIHRQKICAP